MKTTDILNVILVITSVFFIQAVPANKVGGMKVNVSVMPHKKLLLHISNPPSQALTLDIAMTSTGETVYQGKLVRDSVYIKVFDLSQLPEGFYTMSVQTKEKAFIKELKLDDHACMLIKESEYYKPEFDNEDNRLLITYINPKQEKIVVSFRNNSGSFFKDETQQVRNFRRKYNLEMLEPGDYVVDLIAGENIYNYSFEVK